MHEIVEDFRTDTYRAVYTVQFADVVYVLHVFQKKSKRGAETPRSEVELIKSRLKLAKEHYEGWRQGNESTKKINVTPSGGNVFADLGLPEAENRLLKAQLALKIQHLIDQKGMTQAEIAPLLGLDQPKVSNLMRGRPASRPKDYSAF